MLELQKFLNAGSTTISNLILKNYRALGINEEEVMLYFQLLMNANEGKAFPDMKIIGETMGLSIQEVYSLIQTLINKHIIKLESQQNEAGQQIDYYDVTVVYEALKDILNAQKQKSFVEQTQIDTRHLLHVFEQEFGRSLSSIERESINYWVFDDHYSPEIIELALKEAVLNQVYNIKYIDRILLSWERKNLRSKAQVLNELNHRKNQLRSQDKQAFINEQEKNKPKIPLFNWLENEDK
ncbi:DnaD domain-containing protein [Vagococcus xieshaowenii]|uniref:DnaD domain protein n=1 Tax=Vagococcus xieshaowenii TaxID=2562451 RepID=A0AAJ5EDP9_9ENTE|nr:DnaD domain protein [Vagococcus xieshaowenii]QCA28681.1 DnaD domain protein [Vagococcus xieshaowenii]TFZ40511.1 DnaD domain protein [Vagococcus xieshaowenii]